MPTNEQFVYWSGGLSETLTVFGQDLRCDKNMDTDPIGGVSICASGFAGTMLSLPNSTNASAVWAQIPGTSPSIEVRQDGHWPVGLMRVRMPNPFTNVTNLAANVNLGTVPAATRREQSGDVARIRGFLQTTALVAAGTVLCRVAHPPLHAVSLGARYSGGTNRLQISTLGDVTFSANLNSEQLWLDGTTYDLLA